MKPKKCKVCEDRFEPMRSLQMVCSPKCGYEYAKLQKQKAWKKEKKVRKEKLMTRTDHLNLLQKVFNAYIRMRDKELPCISCGKPNGAEQAGHYRSVGSSPELRFNESNCFGQCIHCNMHLHGNLIEYRKRLINRIGVDKVEKIESDHPPLKLNIDEIKEKIKFYRKKTREL